MAKILNISGTEITDTGIRKLAEYVKANLTDDYTLVIGCKPGIYDVDAVLIGNGNIFAIECKDWKGKITGGTYGWWKKDDQVIENPLQQARNNTVALGKWLRDKLNIKDLWVKGLLVFTHDDADVKIDIDNNSLTEIQYIPIYDITHIVRNEPTIVTETILSSVLTFFKKYDNSNIMIKESILQKLKKCASFWDVIKVLWKHFIAWENEPWQPPPNTIKRWQKEKAAAQKSKEYLFPSDCPRLNFSKEWEKYHPGEIVFPGAATVFDDWPDEDE